MPWPFGHPWCWLLLLARVPALRIGDARNASAVLEKLQTHRCGARRFNYKCHGKAYDSYLEAHGDALQSIYARAAEQPFNQSILFIGNSHIREVAESFTCQRQSMITLWAHLNRFGCLEASPYSRKCDGGSKKKPCWDELSRAEMHGGGSVSIAVNHPWIYKGILGLKRAFQWLGLDPTALDTIVVGPWNSYDWALGKFVAERAMPLCWRSEALELVGLRPFTLPDFAHALEELGFRGTLLLGGMFGEPVANEEHDRELLAQRNFSFAVQPLAPFPADCASRDCAPRPGHQCLPGPVDFAAAEVAALR